jgi:hypothetical protein
MLDRPNKQAIVAAARAAGLPADKITRMMAIAEDRAPTTGEFVPLVVNQAAAARLLSCSRFLVRRLVRDGRLKQVFLTPDCVRYSTEELKKLAM